MNFDLKAPFAWEAESITKTAMIIEIIFFISVTQF